MAARIRAASMEELKALDQLMRRSVHSYAGIIEKLCDHPDVMRMRSDDIRAGYVLVAECDDRIAGFAIWYSIGELTAELEGLFVDPPFRGRGIADDLLRAVCEAATACGLKNLSVTAIPQAAQFYRRCGFVRAGARSTRFGPATTMIKEIAPG